MNRLPLLRIAEVAFLTSNVDKCAEFYNKLGIEYPEIDKSKIQFAEVGEQLFGFQTKTEVFSQDIIMSLSKRQYMQPLKFLSIV